MKIVNSKQYIVDRRVIKFIVFAFLLSTIYCYLLSTSVFAATDYQLLAPLPLKGASSLPTEKTDASQYIRGIFMLIIAIAGGLAVVMIVFGGIKYMSTDAFEGKSEAKDIIRNAIWGLLLVISAWLILYTINPALVEFNLEIPVQAIRSATGGDPLRGASTGSLSPAIPGGIPMTAIEIAADKEIREQLKLTGVGINSGPCLQGQGYGCTNLNGLPNNAIEGLVTLKQKCECEVKITGGTEPGPHRTHGAGIPAVDMAPTPSLNNYLAKTNPQASTKQNGTQVKIGSTTYTYEVVGANGRSTADHWHVQF